MSQEILRLVDSICRDKNIDKELILSDLENAMVSAAHKAFGHTEEIEVHIDRMNGAISASRAGREIDLKELGRIPAQTAKQVIIQRIREAERGSILGEYTERIGTVVTGTVSRFEGGSIIVALGRAEGILPRGEQIPGESHQPNDRIRAMILDVHEAPHQVKIVLSRTHPDLIRRLFELEVPEIAERIIEIKALAREAGYRTKVAVSSIDSKVDAVGACVGVRGSRIKNIVEQLGGEKIDIVRWNESSQVLISNALKPAEVQEIALCFELERATVVVAEDQLSLAIGKRGQNVRLAARLTGWDIDILTPSEYNQGLDDMEKVLKAVEGVDDVLLDKLLAMGIISLMDVEQVGREPLVEALKIDEALADRLINVSGEAAKRILEERNAAKLAAAQAAKAAAAAAAVEGEAAPAGEGLGQDDLATVAEPMGDAAGGPAADSAGPDEAAPQEIAIGPGDGVEPDGESVSAKEEASSDEEKQLAFPGEARDEDEMEIPSEGQENIRE